MSATLRRDGVYATFRGAVYAANRDADGRLVITSAEPATTALGFVDRYGVGTYTRVVEPNEIAGAHRVGMVAERSCRPLSGT